MLTHLRSQGAPLPPASDNVPLLGAVAAGQWELARAICRISASQRIEDEYEDEFARARLLQELIALPDGEAFPMHLLEQHEATLAETEPDRLDLFRAILAADQLRFLDAFGRILQNHEVETEATAAGSSTPPDKFVAYRFIWFEGLALLRLAERFNLKIEERLLYCPPLARVPMKMGYDGDWALPFGSATG